jgi:5-keto-L-gluconate epimerase
LLCGNIVMTGRVYPSLEDESMRFSFLLHEPVMTLAELDHRMEIVASLGFRGIELTGFSPLGYAVGEVSRLAQKHHLPVVSLLSGWSYGHEGLCLSSPDSLVRERAVARLGDYIGQAAALQAVLMVGLMQGLRSDEPDESVANGRIVHGLRQVAQLALDRRTTLVLEPVNHLQVGFNHTAGDAASLTERVGSPAVGYMLDSFHLNIEEQSVLGSIRAHGSRIRHFHLCETNGGPFGTGHLDFPSVLSALDESGYDRFVSVKVYRKLGWEEGARFSAAFLRACGAFWT